MKLMLILALGPFLNLMALECTQLIKQKSELTNPLGIAVSIDRAQYINNLLYTLNGTYHQNINLKIINDDFINFSKSISRTGRSPSSIGINKINNDKILKIIEKKIENNDLCEINKYTNQNQIKPIWHIKKSILKDLANENNIKLII